LNNGIRMPIPASASSRSPIRRSASACVVDAIEAGYRLIDTAASYLNEGSGRQGPRRSGVARDDLFVTSKLWVQDTGCERTRQAIDKSLRRLQLDHLDLFLIHQPYGDVHGSWRAMEGCPTRPASCAPSASATSTRTA
jgi:2,5-diketo-D-gluconate reductase A